MTQIQNQLIDFSSLFVTILAIIFIIYAIVSKYKQELVLKSFSPKELRKTFNKIDKISDFIDDEISQPDLTEEEQKLEQEKQLEILKPLVSMIGEDVFKRFQKSKASLTSHLNRSERKLEQTLFMDGLENHPQGDLIQLAISSGLIGKGTLDLIQKNPLMLDVVLNKFGPQIDRLQQQLLSNTSNSSSSENSGGYTGEI